MNADADLPTADALFDGSRLDSGAGVRAAAQGGKWPEHSRVASSAEITPEALRLLLSDGNGVGAAFPDQPRAEAIPA